MMKLGIGTAQFGMDYGLTNVHGKCPSAEIKKIFELASEKGIDTVDTAMAYGDSEEVIGATLEGRAFNIITKLSANCLPEEAFEKVLLSLRRLGLLSLYGLLTHQADTLLGRRGEEIWQVLLELKKAGIVQKIGVSVYNSEQITAILERYPIDLIQLPLNLFDQSLWKNGQLKKLKEAGVEIHARSIFLQGVILAPVDGLHSKLEGLKEKLLQLKRFCQRHHITPLQAALAFIWDIPEVDRIIVGASAYGDFHEVILASEQLPNSLDFSQFITYDRALVDPSKWGAA